MIIRGLAADQASGELRRAARLDVLIRADQMRGVRRSLRMTIPGNALLAGVTLAAMAQFDRFWEGLAWFLAAGAVNVARFAHSRVRLKRHRSGIGLHLKRQLDVAALLSALSGIVWACTPLLPAQTGGGATFNLIVAAGITGASVATGFAYARVSTWFVVPVLLSHAVWQISTGTIEGRFLGASIFIYLISLMRSAFQSEKSFLVTTRLKHEARGLARSLHRAHAETSAVAREMSYRALHDPLTGLLNRAGFLRELERRRLSVDRTYCLMMLDLDGFKPINDAFGHKVGDEVLVATARRIGPALPSDTAVARLGGDEFAVVFEQRSADPEQAAAGLIAAVGEPLQCFQGGRLGVSIGIFLGSAANADRALVCADEALYAAKAAGRNRAHVFDEALSRRLEMRRDCEHDLLPAMANGQLQLWYQPIFGEGGRRLCGMEALLRWHHPRHGWIPPVEIVSSAALAGHAEGLFGFIVDEACRMARRLREHGREKLVVAINVSPREISQLPIDAILLSRIAAARLPTSAIEIEITEETALDVQSVAAKLTSLADAGVRIALDDFGVGYSSLASLRQFRAHRIKIDHGLVTDLASSADNRMVLQAVINLGRAMQLDVVAEGIESAEDLMILRALGCQLMQGYHLGRPMPADSLIATLTPSDEEAGGAASAA